MVPGTTAVWLTPRNFPLSKLFVPREPQRKMIEIGTRLDRCNIFAKPGMGKTSATLAVLDTLRLVDDVFPALVVAPLRVANGVWDREVELWSQFNGMRVTKILGTAAERLEALRNLGEINTIHYGLLQWLHETLDGKWPFKTVVPDESSRLKHTRASFQRSKTGKVFLRVGGCSVNANALARYSPRTKYHINLTGTPASNGLQNLYGQHWHVDFGKTLGNSYDAFSKRWFYQKRGTNAEQAVFEPFPHAFDEITSRMRPTTISLDPKDYFDLREPRPVDIWVDLPERLMKDYRRLHREAVYKLSELKTITAVNAGAVTNKCLQFASGHIFDEGGIPHYVHDEKLQALDSLVENMAGAPLLVAYNFKPDRDAILKRFPYATILPSGPKQREVEDAWNEGRIPMLVVHPASCGHGLSLQHGGCDVCFYTVGWDAEFYEQIIERIGPMRQMQSGYDRVVSIYKIMARHTFDKAVNDKVAGKLTLQDAVMEAVK